VNAKLSANLRTECQRDWHVGQIPLSSSTWRRSR
jgi:hypothetical protein